MSKIMTKFPRFCSNLATPFHSVQLVYFHFHFIAKYSEHNNPLN
jgi:hypothetical protein